MNRHTVMIVDDDPRYLELLHFAMEAEGFVVVSVRDSLQAPALAQKHQPHVIVTDVAMPGIDGYELAAELGANRSTASIPVIFVTACSQEAGKRRSFDAKPLRHIMKPFSIPELTSMIRQSIGGNFQEQPVHE